MGCGIIHWNPGFCKEGQGGFVGFRALRASGRGNCVRFCGRPRGPPLRFYKNIFRSLDGRVLDPPLRRTKRPSFLFVGAGPRPARGRGTPQGGFSRPSADSPSAPPLRVSRKLFRIWVGEALGSPAGIRTSHHLLGKTRRSRGIAPAAILEQPGPSGPGGNANRHSDFARRKYSSIFQVRVPRKWGPRGRRIWTRSVHIRRPLAVLW